MSSFSKSRLLATSAIASFALLYPALPAHAMQAFGIHNDQPDTLEITVGEDEEVVGDDIGIYADNGPVIVDNDGEIRGNGTSPGGIDSRPSGGIVIAQPGSEITNSGDISGAANGIATSYFFSEDENGDALPPEARAAGTIVVNTGLISGEAGAGVSLTGGGSVTNDGTIRGRDGFPGSGVNGIGVAMSEFPDAVAEGVDGIGTIVNNGEGVIEGQTFGVILSGGGTIENGGIIRTTGQFNPAIPGAQTPIAIVMGATPAQEGRSATLTNTGLVQGFLGIVATGSLETVTIENSGTINGQALGILGSSAGALVIDNAEDGQILAGGNAVTAGTSTLTLTNAGLIQSQSQIGVNVQSADAVIDNSGTISGKTFGITTNALQTAPGVSVHNAVNTAVTNSGLIRGETDDGVRLIGGGSVTNSGTIEGVASTPSTLADGVSMFSYAGQDLSGVTAIGTITNSEDGTIRGDRFGAIISGGGVVENEGLITGNTGGLYIQTNTVEETGKTASVTNSGTISGGNAITFGSNLESSELVNSGSLVGTTGYAVANGSYGRLSITNAEDGVIEGATIGVYDDEGGIDLVNAGTIRGNGSYDGFDAPPHAGVTLAGAPSTIDNSGTISGAGAGITTAYYFNVETGQLEGRATGTEIVNSGTIAGESNDGVRLIGGGSVTNSGTISGAGRADADGISMYGYADQASDGYSALVSNAEGGSITGDRFGIILSGGGDVDNAGAIEGVDGGLFIQGTALNSGDRSGLTASVVNSGTISGSRADGVNGYGVGFGSDLATATLDNSGTISSEAGAGVFHGTLGDVTITNAEGATIEGGTHGVYAGGDGSLVLDNAGTIRGNGAYEGPDATADAGVMVQSAGAEIANSGTISGAGYGIVTQLYYNDETGQTEIRAVDTSVTNSGTIRGDANDAVRLFGGGSVVNSGTIEGVAGDLTDGITIQAFGGQDTSGSTMLGSVDNQAGGTISGVRYGILAVSGASVTNAGTISGGLTGVVIGNQNSAGKEAALVNSGTINGGALIDVDSATATNSGTIVSETGVALTSLGRIDLVNSGTLSGGNGVAAVLSAFDDSVTLRTGSAITGLVDAGDGVDSLTLDGDILELTEAQQLTAATGFEALKVASGYWSTSGEVGEFDTVTIDEGSALQVNEVAGTDGAMSPILTSAVTTNGLLVLNFGEDDVVSELDDLTIAGTGQLQLIGDAVFTVDTDSVAHTGGTIVSNGGLVLTGLLQGDVKTEGDGYFELGAGGTEGSFAGNIVNDGRFVFNRSDDYDFLGAFSGSGTLDKLGDGTLTFMGDYAFQGVTHILGGAVRIGGTIDSETDFDLGAGGSLDITGKDQTIGGLSGDTGSQVTLGESQLTVAQEDNSEFAGAISGSGGIVKSGTGTLNLSGDSDYTGPTTVDGGKLAVNGSIVSDVTVNDGGALGGNGSVGSTTINGGGALTPGNSIGRLTVNGDLDFAAGSVYEVEVNAAGQGDRVDATGLVTIDSGASVAVMAADGDYNGRTDYVIVTGAGGIDGTFGSVTSDLAFLDPLLRYSSTAVTLSLYRNDVDFADVAVGFNQAGVAAAVQSRGIDDPLFEAVVNQNAAGAQAAFGDLSGEILASTISGLTDDSRHLRNALFGLTGPEDAGAFVWGSAFGGWGDFDAAAGRSGLKTDHKGFVTGIGYGGKGFAAALSAGIGNSDFRLGGRNDRAKADSKYLAAHLTYGTGAGFRAAAGLAYGWHDVDTVRTIGFAPLAQTLGSNRDANTLQLFGEVGYDVKAGSIALTPFARLAHVRTKSDAFVETGGNAALALATAKQETTFLSLGGRARFNADQPGFQPYLSAAWNRASGDRGAPVLAGFASGGGSFALIGTLIPRNSAEVEAGFDYSSGNLRIGAAYSGTLASDRSTHGVRITARIAF